MWLAVCFRMFLSGYKWNISFSFLIIWVAVMMRLKYRKVYFYIINELGISVTLGTTTGCESNIR